MVPLHECTRHRRASPWRGRLELSVAMAGVINNLGTYVFDSTAVQNTLVACLEPELNSPPPASKKYKKGAQTHLDKRRRVPLVDVRNFDKAEGI